MTSAGPAPERDRKHSLRAIARRRWKALTAIVVFVLGLLLFALTRVDESLTSEDLAVIERLGVSSPCKAAHGNFSEEVRCFEALQSALMREVPDPRCVHVWGQTSHEPSAVIGRRRGCCFSRSRLIEKALRAFDYEVRHVALFARSSGYFALDVLRSVNSHSTTEVRSSRGWLIVDSNHPFVPIAKDGAPYTAIRLREQRPLLATQGLSLPRSFLNGDYHVIYGLYSRHGGFYAPHVPLPDIGWRDVVYNLTD